MEDFEKIPRDGFEPASCAEMGASLSAYHDGELDAASAARVELHLAVCPDCQAELQEIRELSSMARRIGSEGISEARLRRIHRAVDSEEGYTILRIAALLTGLAASAVIVGSVWLSEIPAPQPRPFVVITQTDSPAMSVAVDLTVNPLPKTSWEVRDQPMLADARLAQWMLHELRATERAR